MKQRTGRGNRRAVKTAVLLTIVAFALLLPFVGSLAVGVPGTYFVNATSLYVRKTASATAPIVATLKKNEQVRVLSFSGNYAKLVTSKGVTGYSMTKYLTVVISRSAASADIAAPTDWPSKYIDTSKANQYTYAQCQKDMGELISAYGNARVETIGKSAWGTPIKALVLGSAKAKKRVLIQAAIHARECMTTTVVMRQAENLLRAAKEGASYNGIKASEILKQEEIWVVPVANPDGVALVLQGASAAPASRRSQLVAMNGNSTNFTRWKANGNGVDLNRNFDFCWKKDPAYTKPGPSNFPGTKPFTEPEAKALRDLTVSKAFDLTVSYHATGKIIYWYGPKQSSAMNATNNSLAMDINKMTTYAVLPASKQDVDDETGGYRDWYMAKYMKPGFTVEIGTGSAPLPQSQFSGIWSQNRYVMLRMAWFLMPGTSRLSR